MSNDNPVARVTRVVKALVSQEAMFTLFDVSKAVNADGGQFIRHLDLRDISKPIVEMLVSIGTPNCDYEAEVIAINLGSGSVNAVLYRPSYADPLTYAGNLVQKHTPKAMAPATAPKMQKVQATAPVATSKKTSTTGSAPSWASGSKYFKVVSARSDGNVEIPKQALREAGLDAQDVLISNHPNSVSLVQNGNFKGYSTGDRSVRVTKQNLKKSNIIGKQIGVAAFNGKIVLTRA